MSAVAAEVAPRKSWTRVAAMVARIVFGLGFFVFGLMGLCFPQQPPAQLAPGAMAFAGALMQTGYMFPLIFGTQLVVGALLLINRFVPLALVLIAPFIVNSMAFHLFLEHSGLPMAAVFAALEIYLVWSYRQSYRSLFAARAAV